MYGSREVRAGKVISISQVLTHGISHWYREVEQKFVNVYCTQRLSCIEGKKMAGIETLKKREAFGKKHISTSEII